MSASDPGFRLEAALDEGGVIGARWWQASVDRFGRSRRAFLKGAAVVGGAAGAFFLLRSWRTAPLDAQELQESDGWDVGAANQPLRLDDRVPADEAGQPAAAAGLDLVSALAPRSARWQPYYVPTLFRWLSGPRAAPIGPVDTPSMRRVRTETRAFLQLLEASSGAERTALVVDLPGEDSIAAASVLVPRFDAVHQFDNWPHPLGLVPSERVLGAALYQRPSLTRHPPADGLRPAFILDARRLTPKPADRRVFDNRYVARPPPASELLAAGLDRLVYLRAEATPLEESDDLNAAFVEYEERGIAVRFFALAHAEGLSPDRLTGYFGDSGVPRVSYRVRPRRTIFDGGVVSRDEVWPSRGSG